LHRSFYKKKNCPQFSRRNYYKTQHITLSNNLYLL
jgi:hypothetical protein